MWWTMNFELTLEHSVTLFCTVFLCPFSNCYFAAQWNNHTNSYMCILSVVSSYERLARYSRKGAMQREAEVCWA